MKFALIGQPLGHSYSALLHTHFGLDYRLHPLAPEELQEFVKNCPYDGFNVTIPYKKAIMPYLDEVSKLARQLGAVNTVVRQNGRWVGYNTDYDGLVGALAHHHIEANGKHALVLGSGGAGSMACEALRRLGAASVTTISRHGAANYQNCHNLVDTQLIVNATPVGMYPAIDRQPLDLTPYTRLEAVYDLVYNPHRTALVCDAQRKGCVAAGGLVMLVIQALAARALWTGTPHDERDVQEGVRVLQSDTVHLALCGMPSAGKSTVGAAVARALGKPFCDVDAEIERIGGRSAEAIIRQDGEEAFRTIESEVLRQVCLRGTGQVIALGGGSVLRPENRLLLRQTCYTVYLMRDIDRLQDIGRPTLQQQGARHMYAVRHPIYRAVADAVVSNDGNIDDTIKEICTLYENFGD